MNITKRTPAWCVSNLSIISLLIGLQGATAQAIPVYVADAPDSNLELTIAAISSAKSTLVINIYELTSPQIVDAIIAQVNAGVKTEILEEGGPVGGLSAAARGVQSQIVQAMNGKSGDHFFEMKGGSGTPRRFRYDHAKYIVMDGAGLLIGSENYSPTGNPQPGTKGNRGWEVYIQDQNLAQQFAGVFMQDSSTRQGDVTELTTNGGSNLQSFLDSPQVSQVFTFSALTPMNASEIVKITSPDNSVGYVVALIQNAKSSIDIEQMTFDSAWKGASSSPVLDAVIAAANRGVRVRILLNDDVVFDHPGTTSVHKNQITVDGLRGKANITAKIANLKAMGVDYIHNKGMLIDGDETLISSINWDENSFTNNREAAVVIASTEVNQFYENLFDRDWSVSNGSSTSEPTQPTAPTKPPKVPKPPKTPKPPKGLTVDSMVVESADLGTFTCPKQVRFSIDGIKLSLGDAEDKDFGFLKNLKVDNNFVVQDAANCTLVEATADKSTTKKAFLQIRKNAQGEITIAYEGYTPNTAKLFSIRSKLDQSNDQILGAHQAGIFDGSGPSKEKIGQAVLNLK